MKFDRCSSCSWKIPKTLERTFGAGNIKKQLGTFDRICQSSVRPCHASFFIINYRTQKITVGALETPLFTGYQPSLIETEGIDFYNRILSEDEQDWLDQVSKAAMSIFCQTPLSERSELTFSYELIAKTIDERDIILQHTVSPYKLDNNGNMWLGLCRVKSASRLSALGKAYIINHHTGEQFDYSDGQFQSSATKLLTEVEIEILTHKANGLQGKEIASVMKMSESMVKRKQQELFDKLNVTTSTAAVYKATLMKII